MVELPVLAGPHLVLADARRDDRVLGRAVTQLLEHVLGLEQVAVVRLLVDQGVLLLPPRQGLSPRGEVGPALRPAERSDRLDQLLDHQAAVTDDRHVRTTHLAELGRVDVDVDDLRVRSEPVELARDTVVEPAAERDEQIGLLHRGDRRVVAVHAGHAEAQLVVVGERATGHERRDDRDAGQLGQLAQRLRSACLEDAATGVEHRSVAPRR